VCYHLIIHDKRRKLDYTHKDRVGNPTKGKVLEDYPESLLLDDNAENVSDCLLRGIPAIQIRFPPRDLTPFSANSGGASPQSLVTLCASDYPPGTARDGDTQERVDQFDHFTPQISFPEAVNFVIEKYRNPQEIADFYQNCRDIPDSVINQELFLSGTRKRHRSA
jgi:hypothetical protein